MIEKKSADKIERERVSSLKQFFRSLSTTITLHASSSSSSFVEKRYALQADSPITPHDTSQMHPNLPKQSSTVSLSPRTVSPKKVSPSTNIASENEETDRPVTPPPPTTDSTESKPLETPEYHREAAPPTPVPEKPKDKPKTPRGRRKSTTKVKPDSSPSSVVNLSDYIVTTTFTRSQARALSTDRVPSGRDSTSMADLLDTSVTNNILTSLKYGGKKKKKEEVYCTCRRPFFGVMVCCDVCDEWFHIECVGLSEDDANKADEWECKMCLKKKEIKQIEEMKEEEERRRKEEAKRKEDLEKLGDAGKRRRSSLGGPEAKTDRTASSSDDVADEKHHVILPVTPATEPVVISPPSVVEETVEEEEEVVVKEEVIELPMCTNESCSNSVKVDSSFCSKNCGYVYVQKTMSSSKFVDDSGFDLPAVVEEVKPVEKTKVTSVPVVDLNKEVPTQPQSEETKIEGDTEPVKVDSNEQVPTQSQLEETKMEGDTEPVKVDSNEQVPTQSQLEETKMEGDTEPVKVDSNEQVPTQSQLEETKMEGDTEPVKVDSNEQVSTQSQLEETKMEGDTSEPIHSEPLSKEEIQQQDSNDINEVARIQAEMIDLEIKKNQLNNRKIHLDSLMYKVEMLRKEDPDLCGVEVSDGSMCMKSNCTEHASIAFLRNEVVSGLEKADDDVAQLKLLSEQLQSRLLTRILRQ
ncbi:hypothetical protein GEMRC1_012236 [Eukaryota sp. GEM-RC1]